MTDIPREKGLSPADDVVVGEHDPTYGRQAVPHESGRRRGAAGRHYNTTVRCSCGWSDAVAEAPSYGGRKVAEQRFAAHVAVEPMGSAPPPLHPGGRAVRLLRGLWLGGRPVSNAPCPHAVRAYTSGKVPTAYWTRSTLGCDCEWREPAQRDVVPQPPRRRRVRRGS